MTLGHNFLLEKQEYYKFGTLFCSDFISEWYIRFELYICFWVHALSCLIYKYVSMQYSMLGTGIFTLYYSDVKHLLMDDVCKVGNMSAFWLWEHSAILFSYFYTGSNLRIYSLTKFYLPVLKLGLLQYSP